MMNGAAPLCSDGLCVSFTTSSSSSSSGSVHQQPRPLQLFGGSVPVEQSVSCRPQQDRGAPQQHHPPTPAPQVTVNSCGSTIGSAASWREAWWDMCSRDWWCQCSVKAALCLVAPSSFTVLQEAVKWQPSTRRVADWTSSCWRYHWHLDVDGLLLLLLLLLFLLLVFERNDRTDSNLLIFRRAVDQLQNIPKERFPNF